MQITRSDWEATPRRDMLAIWLWVNGVPPNRGAMRVLPGSHLPIADHWERTVRDAVRTTVHISLTRALPRRHPDCALGGFSGRHTNVWYLGQGFPARDH